MTSTDRMEALKVAISKAPALWDAGYDWGYELRLGQVFRGSYGEAKHRGLIGVDADMFHLGAQAALDGWKGIFTVAGRISKLEAL